MVDAVPASLVYARDYLRAACPDARIGFYYDSDAADIDSFDCYIAPAWHFEGLSSRCLHRLVRSHRRRRRDLLHLQRARRPIPRFVELPADMAAVVPLQHPRSWTHDHPTEVFVRAAGDNRAVNAAIEAAYRRSLQRWVPPRYGVPTPMVEELDADRLLGPPAALVTADSRSFAGFEGRYR